jgi:hypothetical protein
MKITPGPSLLGPCPNLVTETWGPGGALYQSAFGQPLFVPTLWQGYAYIETVCNGKEHASWPQVTCAQAGFAQICVEGKDVTATSLVCWDIYKTKYRPTVPIRMDGAPPCP